MPNEPICTLILAGGYGTRLGDLGRSMAKPLLRIKGKTILDHILEKTNKIQCPNQTYILINSKFATQYEHWIRQRTESLSLTLVNNQDLSADRAPDIITNIAMTISQMTPHSDLLIIGGDNFFDFSLWDFVVYSRAHRGISTVLVDVKTIEEARQFSVVSLDKGDRIMDISEKPSWPSSLTVTTCIYWFPKDRLHYFSHYSKEMPHSESFGQFFQWVCAIEPVFGYRCLGNWHDIGTREVYESLAEPTRQQT